MPGPFLFTYSDKHCLPTKRILCSRNIWQLRLIWMQRLILTRAPPLLLHSAGTWVPVLMTWAFLLVGLGMHLFIWFITLRCFLYWIPFLLAALGIYLLPFSPSTKEENARLIPRGYHWLKGIVGYEAARLAMGPRRVHFYSLLFVYNLLSFTILRLCFSIPGEAWHLEWLAFGYSSGADFCTSAGAWSLLVGGPFYEGLVPRWKGSQLVLFSWRGLSTSPSATTNGNEGGFYSLWWDLGKGPDWTFGDRIFSGWRLCYIYADLPFPYYSTSSSSMVSTSYFCFVPHGWQQRKTTGTDSMCYPAPHSPCRRPIGTSWFFKFASPLEVFSQYPLQVPANVMESCTSAF